MVDHGDLVGHRFPAGTYTLPEYVCWLWSDAAQLPPGLGVRVKEILDLMGATTDDGVMFGEFGVEYHGTLRAGATYECDAEVTDVERKRGSRAGVFDKLSFEVTIREQGCHAPVAVCRNAWIFPRGNGDA
jgi:hypothetical protein